MTDLASAVAAAEAFLQDVRRAGRAAGLSPLETKVLLVLGEPLTSHEIAKLLGIGSDDAFRAPLRKVIAALRDDGLIKGGNARGRISPLSLTVRGDHLRRELTDIIIGNGTPSTGVPHADPLD